ncbi:hypothetical protein IVB69_08690 [Flavobacterium sp. J49]|uniref:hypothetical protein n=1 Tax=Flavobacterium sp. J49 TaxID=2718534 RepID=UPI0015940A74|nr:hypothetical protein [Flavobacterium sp. J49]MBF6641556.1 hypothetical protein [Flavobacterium sp. J49]NIC02803.1 hypothetical protein [Flavobacterium sp. J49]
MKKIVCLSLLLLSCNIVLSQSKVSQSKSELNSSSSSSGNSGNSGSGRSNSSSDDDDEVSIWVEITWGIFKYGFIGDYKHEDHLYSNLTDYPYYNKESGNYENYEVNEAENSKKNFRFDLQNNLLYSTKDLYANHFKLKIRPFQYFYVQTDFRQIFEKNKATHATDRLSLFNFNLGYDRVRLENFNLGWTIGSIYVGNEVKKAGFSFGLNTEIFIGHNISLLAAAKWSTINSQPVHVYELEAKYHVKRGFVSLGYEHLKIASPTYNFVSLGGGIYLN